jgi:tight adherence protein C
VNRLALIIGLLVLVLALAVSASVLAYRLQRQARLTVRLQAIRPINRAASEIAGHRPGYGIAVLVGTIGASLARSGFMPQKTVAGLERTLRLTGLRGPSALGLFLGAKLLLLLVMPVLALVVLQRFDLPPLMRNVSIVAAAVAGLLGPDWWVGRRHKKYLQAVTQGLPDALDLMVICADAGLGFEPAINRVATEIRSAHPAISAEFSQTASELRMVADSKVALDNMAIRTGLEGVKRMTSMLAQTMRYGTPLSDALRVLSAEMRQETLIRFETRAARLPVLLTIPIIFFILPCIFLIVGGPALIQVMQSYHH